MAFPPIYQGHEPRTNQPLLAENDCNADEFLNITVPLLEWAISGAEVQSLATNTPPGSPAGGQAWIIGASPTQDWRNITQGTVALWDANRSEWNYMPLRVGFIFKFGASTYVWTGATMSELDS